MGTVIRFPGRHAQRSRAAKLASSSGDTFASRALGEAKIADHHSEGMRSRWNHLLTAEDCAPISEASASRDGQSSMTDRNEPIFGMPNYLGHLVLNGKANLSQDCGNIFGLGFRMGTEPSMAAFRKAFQLRVVRARLGIGASQEDMAGLLQLGEGGQGKYKQWETRSWMPHTYIPIFCQLTHIEIAWLYTGKGRAPLPAPVEDIPAAKKRGRKSKIAA